MFALASGLSGLMSFNDQFGDNPYNYYGFKPSDFDNMYQKLYEDQQRVWEREDSAYQRMVEDMKKAGLNPWTGISSGGLSTSSSSPSSEALKGLIAGLEYNKSVSDSQRKSDEKWADQMISLLKIFAGFGTGMMNALS